MNEPSEIGPRYQTLSVKEADYSLWLSEQGMSLRGDFGVKHRFRVMMFGGFNIGDAISVGGQERASATVESGPGIEIKGRSKCSSTAFDKRVVTTWREEDIVPFDKLVEHCVGYRRVLSIVKKAKRSQMLGAGRSRLSK
jgi:hypothetical protein